MKTVSMSGSPRESVGKKDAKRHRKEGNVPCVLYGGKEQIHFVTSEKSFAKILFTPETYFIKLEVDGKQYDCVLKDIQYHPVGDQVLHADFMEFTKDKEIQVDIPITTVGTAPGIIKGGVLVKKFRKIPIKALPENMPEYIEIDISELDIHDTIHVGDLKQDDFTLMEKDERFVIGVMTTRLAAVAEPGEEELEEGEEGVEGEEGAAEGEEGATPEADAKSEE